MTLNKWFMNRRAKKIIFGVGLAVVLLVFFVPTTYAVDIRTNDFGNTPKFIGTCTAPGPDFLLCGLTSVAHWAILGLFYALGNLFAMILSAGADLVIWAIGTLGVQITTHEAVSFGFGISLKIANVVFVVAIIMIAFATILRWHEYEAKKMLPKLIITALLVNFSLLAAGLMLDVGNVFTTYFLEENRVTSAKIGQAFNPQMFNTPKNYGGNFTNNQEMLAELRTRYNSATSPIEKLRIR
ncbi:MAG: hypothetical protein Q7R62_02955, partial [bacterium]|nr:hypothetical protein [bacterium]